MFAVVKEAVYACRRKGYLGAGHISPGDELELPNLLSARQAIRLSDVAREKLKRQGREESIFAPEVLPGFCQQLLQQQPIRTPTSPAASSNSAQSASHFS